MFGGPYPHLPWYNLSVRAACTVQDRDLTSSDGPLVSSQVGCGSGFELRWADESGINNLLGGK